MEGYDQSTGWERNMEDRNVELVKELLLGATDPEVVQRIVDPSATYVSLTFENTELKKLMPWAGVHKDGPAAILWTFQHVNSFWKIEDLTIEDAFGSNDKVAIFGRFTTHSVRLKKRFTSPFAVLCRLRNARVIYMQYMEDTFGTGSTFRSSGSWTFMSDPAGGQEVVGSIL